MPVPVGAPVVRVPPGPRLLRSLGDLPVPVLIKVELGGLAVGLVAALTPRSLGLVLPVPPCALVLVHDGLLPGVLADVPLLLDVPALVHLPLLLLLLGAVLDMGG